MPADPTWFSVGFVPTVPLQAIWLYVSAASDEMRSARGHGASVAGIMPRWRTDAWEDYTASLAHSHVPDDAYYNLNHTSFNSVWNLCLAVWANTSPEMRKHDRKTRASSRWAEHSHDPLYRHRFAWINQLVVQGRIDKAFDDAHIAPTGSNRRLIVEYQTITRNIDRVVADAASQTESWRDTGSELWILAGWTNRILTF